MELSKVKNLYLKHHHQFMLLDETGVLEQSCNSLTNVDDWINTPIYTNIPFFETLKVDIDTMRVGERQDYNCFSFLFNDRQGIYDIVIQKEIVDEIVKFICVVEERSEQYQYWLSIQQERNESHIGTEIIQKQNKIIAEANREITDSINYAKRIQNKILPSNDVLAKFFHNYFLIYKPKDIVSGDFYWVKEKNNKIYFCIADATGHGVPGAIMSVIGNGLFNEGLENEADPNPGQILNYARNGIIDTLKQNFEPGSQLDGMDAAMCCFQKETKTLEYSGANNSVIIITDKQDSLQIKNTTSNNMVSLNPVLENDTKSMFEVLPNKNPIALHNGQKLAFTNYSIPLKEGDRIYLSSDGYRDQFGGPNEKKIGVRNYRRLLLDTNNLDLEKQKGNLNIAFETWKGKLEQIDDVCLFCFKI